MANGRQSQVQWKFQRPAEKIYRVGPVGSGAYFTSIQTAINQAVADGYTSNDNPATIELAPGTYTENLTLAPGISLTGPTNNGLLNANGTGGLCTVVGSMTYSPVNGLNRTQNSIAIQNINFTHASSAGVLQFAGTSAGQITFNGCTIQQQSGGTTSAVVITNTNSAGRLRFNAGCAIDMNFTGSPAVSMTGVNAGFALDFRQRNTSIFSSAGTQILAGIQMDSGQLTVWGCDGFMNGPFSVACINLTGSGAVANISKCRIGNTLVANNANTLNIGASGATIRARWCVLSCAASVGGNAAYLVNGVAGGIYQQGNNVLIGTNQAAKNVLTINTDGSAVVPTA